VSPARRRDERGFVAIELALGVGLLLIPVALLVITIPTWSERQATARAIVREVARSTAVAGVCDTGAADETADTMADNLGVEPGEVEVDLRCFPGERLPRGGEVEAAVTIQMPAMRFPGITQVGGWDWTANHREPVDPYRSFE
jgi:hypothetical protein